MSVGKGVRCLGLEEELAPKRAGPFPPAWSSAGNSPATPSMTPSLQGGASLNCSWRTATSGSLPTLILGQQRHLLVGKELRQPSETDGGTVTGIRTHLPMQETQVQSLG